MRYQVPKAQECFRWYKWLAWRPITLFNKDGAKVIVWQETLWRFQHYSNYYGHSWEYRTIESPDRISLHKPAFQNRNVGGITSLNLPENETIQEAS